MIQRNEYKSSRGILKANIGTEHPGMVVTSSATQFASPPQTSTASPSATPPPATSVEATVEASEISGNSTQNLPRSSPQNAEIAAATTEPGSATPSSHSAPTPTSVCANVDAPGINSDLPVFHFVNQKILVSKVGGDIWTIKIFKLDHIYPLGIMMSIKANIP